MEDRRPQTTLDSYRLGFPTKDDNRKRERVLMYSFPFSIVIRVQTAEFCRLRSAVVRYLSG